MMPSNSGPSYYQDSDYHYCMQCGYKESYQRLDIVPIHEQVQKMRLELVIVTVVALGLGIWYLTQ